MLTLVSSLMIITAPVTMLRTHSKRRWFGVLDVIYGMGVGARDR